MNVKVRVKKINHNHILIFFLHMNLQVVGGIQLLNEFTFDILHIVHILFW